MSDYAGLNVWLIGASSGIGRSLAFELDRRGARLALSARREEDLKKLNGDLNEKHLVIPCDVTNSLSVSNAAQQVSLEFAQIDIILFFAGIYEPMKLEDLNLAKANEIIQTNLVGAINLIHSVLPLLLKQKKSKMAFCASVAGYRGLANAQPYGATKAALINLTESLRAEVYAQGIDVRLINPGFVKTPMTNKNSFPMPMMIESTEAATIIADGLKTNHFEIYFPKRFSWIMKFLRFIPDSLYFRIIPK